MTNKRFRVALSYAGEKRDFVSRIARILADLFGENAILYDKYHEAEFARARLAWHLSDLYRNDTDLVVAVLCKDYTGKEWCGLEWDAIYSRIKGRDVKDVMLTRFDQVDGSGLVGLAGFVDLDQKSPDEAATLILERLAVNENLPKGHYTAQMRVSASSLDWPKRPPKLHWPVADHRQARQAFAKFITRSSKHRVLPIHGPSETGKSHLTKQFLGNALKIPNLRCGRFDFKGSADIRQETRRFSEGLGVESPASDIAVAAQLTQILASAKKAARPTVLLFDTFEQAGEAERSVIGNLLLSAIRASWLRVVVVGQRALNLHAEPWEEVSLQPILLSPPSAEEWFEYGQLHKPNISLEFVNQAYDCCNGRSPVLAQLLGPCT